jgi:hypothetical protein
MNITDDVLSHFFGSLDTKLQKCFSEIEELVLNQDSVKNKVIYSHESRLDVSNEYSPYSTIGNFYFIKLAEEYDRGLEMTFVSQYTNFDYIENKPSLTKTTGERLYLLFDINSHRENDFESEIYEYEIRAIETPNQLNEELIEEICSFFSSRANIIAKTLNDNALEDESRP